VAYTQVATIATDDHHTLQEFRASVGAQWTFLSDPARIVQKISTFGSTPIRNTTR
jgi:peroxiredoxin